MTNGDVFRKKISEAPDEAIAYNIVENVSFCPGSKEYSEKECDRMSCYDCWIEWLKEDALIEEP